MKTQQDKKIGKREWDFLKLISYGLHQKAVPADALTDVPLDEIYRLSDYHMLTALVYDAIEPTVNADKAAFAQYEAVLATWRERRDKALRKNLLLDADRKQLFAYMEKQGIWYMPLKGSILKDLYPKAGMREMSDNDILFDPAYSKEIKDYMEDRGYHTEEYGAGAHDSYLKEPVYNFEMHRMLFSNQTGETWRQYYEDVKEHLVKDTGNSYGYHFTENDLYVYEMAHAYKHHKGSGTGIRTLTDCYILNEAYVDRLDYEYIEQELSVFGADGFEQTLRGLVHKLFAPETFPGAGQIQLSAGEQAFLTECMFAGTYGTLEGRVEHSLQELQPDGQAITAGTKWKYVWKRLIPDMSFYKTYVPVVYKYKILIPFYMLFRLIRGPVRNHRKIREELHTVIKK